MNAVQPFEFPATGQTVRTVVIDGEPGLVAKDACAVIGISKYRDAVAQLDEDERVSVAVDTPGGPQVMTVVTEAGMYALMMISRSPRVKPFRRWVTHEVLPAIRRTGGYFKEIPQTFADALELAARQVRELEAAQAENAKLKVKAEAFDEWINGKGCYLVGTVAKMLGLGPNTLFDFLYAEKILIKSPGSKRHREPYSRPDTRGWFEIKAVPPAHANGHAAKTSYVTPHGAERIRLLLIKRGLLPAEQLALIGGDPS